MLGLLDSGQHESVRDGTNGPYDACDRDDCATVRSNQQCRCYALLSSVLSTCCRL